MADGSRPIAVLCVGPTGAVSDLADAVAGDRADVSVATATTVEGATAALDGRDCVVTTHALEGGDGVELTRAIRARDRDRPVVFVARDGDEDLAARAVDAGASAYVPWREASPPASLGERVRDAASAHLDARFARRVQAASPVSTVVLDRDLEVVWANDRARERLDIDGTYGVGDTDVYDADGEWLPPAERPYARVFETGEAVEGWEGQIEIGGERRWISINAAPVTDGGAEYAVVSSVDVTERRERERELEAEKEKFRRLVDAVEDYATFRLDEDGRVASWNEGAEAIKGYSETEIVGEHFSTFYTDEATAAGVPEANLEAARRDGRVEDEGWRVRADGSRFWANVVITALRDESGELVGYSKVTRDTTERRAYEERLEREREELADELDEVLGRVSDAVFALDQNWRFTYVNDRAAELLEVDPDRARGESVWDLFPGAVDTTFEEKYRTAMRDQEPVAFEEFYPPLDRWFEVSAYPSETGLSVYFRDVTERRERQRRYETLVENFPNGAVVLFDEDLRYQLAGGEIPDAVGDGPAALEGERVTDVLPEALAEAVEPHYRAALRGEEASFVVEFGDQARRFHALPVTDATGTVVAGMAMSQDVTERRERERELERYRTLTETTTDGVFMTDEAGRLEIVNDALADLVGRDREDLLGTRVADLVDDRTLRRARAIARRIARDDSEVGRLEFEIETGDGTVPVETTFSLLGHVSDPETDRSRVGIVRDVTERKRHERRLRDLHETTRELFDATTGEAVIDEVVTALTDDLGLSDVVVYRHDGERGAFVPVAESTADTFEPGVPAIPDDAESVVGSVYADGESRLYDEIHEEADATYADPAETALRAAVVAPIGARGVVLVGASERAAFDEGTRQLVEIVAETATAACSRVTQEQEIRDQRERLAALNDLNSLTQDIAEAVVRQSDREDVEDLACEWLADSDSYEFAWIGEADRERGEVALRTEAGVENYLDSIALRLDEDPGASGPTVRALRTREMQVVQDVQSDADYAPWREHAAALGYRSSAAIPIEFRDELYGVLNVYSNREGGFGEEERETLRRLGTIVGHAIRSVERDRRLRESEERYRTLVENLPSSAVGLVDHDLRFETVAGNAFDDLDIAGADLEGKRVDEVEALPEEHREELKAALAAALDGERVREEVEYGDRVYDRQVIPIREDDAVTGALMLSQDVTERRRREEQIEAERERLEFLNRLIRHNLLNSLNVVNARLDLLDGRVDYEVSDHLDTARARTDEMIDLVETIRALMNAIAGGGDEELEPVDVTSVVEDEVEMADASFAEATFAFRADGEATVLADDLLGEVFENLLTNAVQHNDAEVPRVEVTVERGDDAVTVRVADNGPGVPEDLREDIFGKGTKSFDSPGTGFGLHLSREIVDAYGGDIAVENREEGGAAFEVTLPRADG